jgi:hypothetical protein
MDATTAARREAGAEIARLAEAFEASDTRAFRLARVLCWAITALAAGVVVFLLLLNADWRYLAASWVVVVGLTWGAYALSRRRQRAQTEALRALAERWLAGPG